MTAIEDAQHEAIIIGLMRILQHRDDAADALRNARDGIAEFAALGPEARANLAEAERRWAEERAKNAEPPPTADVVPFMGPKDHK